MPRLLQLIFILPFCLLIPIYAFSQSTLEKYNQELQDSHADSNQIKILHKLAIYYQKHSKDSSVYYAQKGLSLAQQIADPWWLIRANMTVGFIYHNTGDPGSGKIYNREALALANKHGFKKLMPNIHVNLGNSYKRLALPDSAFYHFTQAEKVYLELGENIAVWKAYAGLSRLYFDKQDMEKAIEYGREAYEVVIKGNSRIDIGYCLYNITIIYFMIGDIENFAEFSEKWNEFESQKQSNTVFDDNQHVGLQIFYTDDIKELEAKVQKAIAFETKRDNQLMIGTHYHALGYYYFKRNQVANAINAWEKAIPHLRKANVRYQLYDSYSKLYELHKKQGDTNKSLEFLELQSQLKDSIRQEGMLKNLNELEVKYESEKKDLEINQKTQQRNLLLLSFILLTLLAVSILLFLRNRLINNKKLAAIEKEIQNQRINQLEQEKKITAYNSMIEGQENEQHRIAKDLHDSIGVLLSTIKAHFTAAREQNGQFKNTAIYQKTDQLIDETCEEVRRISHNMMPRALVVSGLKDAIADLIENLELKGFHCEAEILGLDDQLDKKKAAMIYRILQELIQNIQKHAQAKSVFIQLLQNENEIKLLVEDDGKGFDMPRAKAKKGLGLQNIEYRVKYLQGTIDFDTVKGEGTTVMINIPGTVP